MSFLDSTTVEQPFITEANKARVRKLIIVPNPERPEVSVLRWETESPDHPPFDFQFSILTNNARRTYKNLVRKTLTLLDQTQRELGIEIEAIVTLQDEACQEFASPIAAVLGIPKVTYHSNRRRFSVGSSRRHPGQTLEHAAFIEPYHSLGLDSYDAIDRLRRRNVSVPIHVSLVSWGLSRVQNEFSGLGVKTVSLATLAELRADPLFVQRYAAWLETFDRGYRERVLALDEVPD